MAFTATVSPTYTGTIENDGFWPDLDIEQFMKNYGVDTRKEEGVIYNLLVNALIVANGDLEEMKIHQMHHLNSLTLADFEPDRLLGGKHFHTMLYYQAVYNRAKGDYLHEFVDYSTTGARGQSGQGEDRVQEKQKHSDHYYAASLKAVRRLKGRRGTRVALIKGNVQGSPARFF